MSAYHLELLGRCLLAITVVAALFAWPLLVMAHRLDVLDKTATRRAGPGAPKHAAPMFVDANPTYKWPVGTADLVRPLPAGAYWSEIPPRGGR